MVKPPNRVAYPQGKIKFRHYGRSIESFIAKASKMENGEEKDSFTYYIANMMKKNYLLYNRDSVSDDLIFDQLKTLSNGALEISDKHTLKSTGSLVGKKGNPNKGNNKRHTNNKKGGKRPFKRR